MLRAEPRSVDESFWAVYFGSRLAACLWKRSPWVVVSPLPLQVFKFPVREPAEGSLVLGGRLG